MNLCHKCYSVVVIADVSLPVMNSIKIKIKIKMNMTPLKLTLPAYEAVLTAEVSLRRLLRRKDDAEDCDRDDDDDNGL